MEQRTGEGGEIMAAEEQADMMAPAERASIDIQITTAKHNPRSITQFYRKANELATLDKETAKSCIYSIPRGGRAIVGPNVRLAEIVAACWGNIRVKAKATHHDGKFAYAEAVAWDLENNTAIGASARQPLYPKRDKNTGNLMALDQDTIVNAMGAAESKALRNAIFKVVPQAVVRPIYLKVCDAIGGSEETMDVRREKMMNYFLRREITVEQVCAAVGVVGVADITIEHMLVLHGIAQAIKDGVLTLEAAFPPEQSAEEKLAAGRMGFGLKAQKAKEEQPPTEDQAGTFVCACGFKAKSKRGLSIHQSKCKAPEPEPEPEPEPAPAEPPETAPPSEPDEQAVPSDGPAQEAPEAPPDPPEQAAVNESPPVVNEPQVLPTSNEPAQEPEDLGDEDLTQF